MGSSTMTSSRGIITSTRGHTRIALLPSRSQRPSLPEIRMPTAERASAAPGPAFSRVGRWRTFGDAMSLLGTLGYPLFVVAALNFCLAALLFAAGKRKDPLLPYAATMACFNAAYCLVMGCAYVRASL